ncbi:MAG: xanthine dehydrogenase family protein subunit M [Hyphomicrobiaceae bacterium]|nr:xanthine dehydrogenase family protein subunit M [Hyphomicrobiaceae bacterium]
MQDFVYERPQSMAEAVALLGGGDARVLAGGTDLIVQMREGRRSVGCLVDIKRIGELTGIAMLPEGGVAIGAAATAASVSKSPSIGANYPAVAQSARLIGAVQVQNRASLGGNICNAAPSADAVPALLCHAAEARIAGPAGTRQLPLEQLFVGPGKTTIERSELLVSIVLPPPPARSAVAYLRFTPRREMDIAIAGAGTYLRLDQRGVIAEARVALASVGPTPMRAPTAEHRLVGERPSRALFEEVGRGAAHDARPISDTRGSADYRRLLVAVLTRRALVDCCGQLGIDVEAACQ